MKLNELDPAAVEELAQQIKERDEVARIARKALQKEKEVAQIWSALTSGTYTTKRDRVAFLLNIYPETRKSDITLALRYWETFQPDYYNNGQIDRNNLFKLERQTIISRLRAKVQNEYELFLPDEKVVRHRRQREEEIKGELTADRPISNLIQVFADETGKNASFLIIGSVWFLNPSRVATFQAAVSTLAHEKGIRGEFHFTEAKRQHVDAYRAFIDLAAANGEYMSLKAIMTPNSGREIEACVTRLLRLHLLKGFQHEIDSGRVAPPRRVQVTLDQGATLSALTREELRLDIDQEFKAIGGEKSELERLHEVDSKHSAAVQLADVLSGALNRRFNNQNEQRNFKDDLADYALQKLAPELAEMGQNDAFNLIQLV